MTENNDTDIIAILQNNLRKNQSRTHSILNDPSSSKYTMLILQEQYWSDITESSPINGSWTLIESKSYPNRKPRSAIYINNHILDTSAFRIITIPLPDVTAVAINTINNPKPTMIINIYNPGDENLITPLMEYLQQNIDPSQYHAIIIAGDFNLHHPLWNPPQYHIRDPQADELIEGMLQQGMQLMIPPGTITLPDAKTAIDLVWGNAQMEEKVRRCKVAHNHDHGSDHFPIITTLDLKPEKMEETPMYNFEKTNWGLLKAKIIELLPPITNEPASPMMIDKLAEDLTAALAKAIECTTPRRRICPFSKRWWMEELMKARKEMNKVRNRFRRTKNEEDQRIWKDREKKYKGKIKKCKRNTWRKFVVEADEKTIWKLKKYMDSTPMSSYIPTINETAASNDEKAEIFRSTFFPLPPPADLSDIEAADYVGLTTVRQQLLESGRRGAEVLLAEIGVRSDEPPIVHLAPELVVRATTAPPKEGRG
jgi:hypothetical protein